jgi:hypothetical protein
VTNNLIEKMSNHVEMVIYSPPFEKMTTIDETYERVHRGNYWHIAATIYTTVGNVVFSRDHDYYGKTLDTALNSLYSDYVSIYGEDE